LQEYESVTVLRPTLNEDEIEAEIKTISGLIAASGGEVLEVERWGRRRLAYEIQKVHEGIYTFYHFNGTPQTVQELERRYRLNERLLRHLTVLSEGPVAKGPDEEGEGDGEGRSDDREGRGHHRRDRVIED